ncbi:MAG: hypothetical protein KJO05_10345 [Bacteroidia bacterium]|nr:hypothetical protein [Bacteroidia bacterium]NNF31637.1 hypothetical protein [Flavobacteriaceae bacterium]MBT8275090.1 hypothetical protein [Bacteroidia bacterium]NNJ81254.1 hypothetical protein [Flavobacteriaceae bacterium]NNK53396.1 hypothetical protein [Flavobacteriaceae bacterium]
MKILLRILFLIIFFITGSMTLNAHPAWGIVIDAEANIYFADIFHNGRGSVWKLHKNGTLELLLKDFHSHNVSLDHDGNLVTAHGEQHHTMVRLLGNKVSDTIYTSENFEEFNGGNCTYTIDGDIIFGISNYLWRIDKDGTKSKLSDFRFEWNQTIFSDGEGNYYAPDIGRDNGAVIKIDKLGNSMVVATNLISRLDREYDRHNDVLLGIGKDDQGSLYIAETAGKRIIKFSETGEKETFYTSGGDWFPNGITFYSGEAYILEVKMDNGYEGPRITKLLKDGTSEVIFNYDTHKNPVTSGSSKNRDEEELNLIWFYLGLALIIIVVLLLYRRLNIPASHLRGGN